jgi:hypothetical protein
MTPTDKKKRRKHPTETQEGPSLEERLSALFSSVGAVGAMARQRMEDPAIKILDDYEAQRTAPATKNRLSKVQQTKVGIVIGEELDKFRKQYPKFTGGPWAVAPRIRVVVNQRLKKDLRRKPLSVDSIARYLKNDPHF